MKKIILTASAVALFSVTANAQVQFGFDFNGLTATSDVDGFVSDNSNPLESSSANGISATFNSTLVNANDDINYLADYGFGPSSGAAFNGNVHQVRSGSGLNPITTGNTNAAGGFGQAAGLSFAGEIASDSFTIDFNFGGGTFDIDGLSFAYDIDAIGNTLAGGGFVGATNVWDVSVNGASFSNLGNSVVPNAGSATAQTFALGDLAGVTSLSLRYTFDSGITDLDGDSAPFPGDLDQILFDNFVFFGDSDSVATFTVVPEPSTYAALAGALALAFVAYRRRR